MRRKRETQPPAVEPCVELVYDHGCPHVREARARLLRAFTEAGVVPRWKEWERTDPEAPSYTRTCGSPTILVNGKDVVEGAPCEGEASCRAYATGEGGLQGVPPRSRITAALLRAAGDPSTAERPASPRRSHGYLLLAAIPGLLAGLLPRLA